MIQRDGSVVSFENRDKMIVKWVNVICTEQMQGVWNIYYKGFVKFNIRRKVDTGQLSAIFLFKIENIIRKSYLLMQF